MRRLAAAALLSTMLLAASRAEDDPKPPPVKQVVVKTEDGLVLAADLYEPAGGALQIEQIPWDREAKYRLPVRIWKEMIDIYYPNVAWLCLRRDVFEKLSQYKMDRGIPTWEETLESIIPASKGIGGAELPIEGSLPS